VRILGVLLVAAIAGLAAPLAGAGPLIDAATTALRTDSVYVHPDAEPSITDTEAEDLRAQIEESGEPIFVAVLPAEAREEAGGEAVDVLRELGAAGRAGTYAVVVGGQFRAGSTVLPFGRAADLATEAFQEHRDEGVASTLLAFVDLVATQGREGAEGGDDGDGISPGIVVVLGLVSVPLLFLFVRHRRKRARGFADVREAAEEELVALADDVRELEAPVSEPSSDPAARADYEHALDHYERASRAFDRARRTEDFQQVTASVEEGRYAMAAARARLDGREPPARRPPCFFDPRHGPSTRDVEWAPPGGAPRAVPACEADAMRVEGGEEPAAREVPVGGQRVPYWSAPDYYRPWAGGFFGGGLLPLLFAGSMFGAMSGDVHDDVGGTEDAQDDGWDGGGDFDGGDWGGGGDFGGGGGGDFGGGGGGDF
jgi:hypothetical protein